MPRHTRTPSIRYAAAVIVVAVGWLLQFLLQPVLNNQSPFVILLAGVMFSAWFGRLGPGLVTTVLSALLVDLVIIPPYGRLLGNGLNHDIRLVLFVLEGGFVSWLAERMHWAIEQRSRNEQALISADRRKDEFLAVLAHELRGPLAPISHGLQLLKDPRTDRQTSRQTLDMMGRQLQTVVRLVDDLLDVSRIARGKVALKRLPTDLGSVLERAVEANQPLFTGRGHQFRLTLPPEPVWVNGDALRLVQVFGNLLGNAAKYTPDGGKIRLSAVVADGQVHVSVRDNGIGIPREMLPHVFGLFTQVEGARKRSDGGLGLGLALVRSLVTGHGGQVEVHSSGRGKGSEFIVRLPVTAPPAAIPEADKATTDQPAESTGGRRVLIVDDSADAAEALAMLLAFDGYDVQTAADGPSALVAVATFHPEVVLLDIGLPGMNGYEVARRLREIRGGEKLRIVAMTGHGRAEDRRRSRAEGFDGHLLKPVSIDELQNALGSPTVPHAQSVS